MAARLGPLGGLARRIARPQAVLPLRGGGGGPVPLMRPPTKPLAEEDELMWDDGSVNPEPCLDKFDLVTKWQALGACAAGMGFFAALYSVAAYVDKPSTVPYAPRVYPYDDLKVELGGERREL